MRLFVALIIVCRAPSITAASDAELNPIWERLIAGGAEWVETVSDDPALVLLVCTKDARVDLLDVETGRSRIERPFAVQPGARFAGETHGVAFLYAFSSIYAIRAADDAGDANAIKGLLWRLPESNEPPPDDDPEFLTRIVAARATPGGVFVVMSDGRCVELLAADGAVRRQYETAPISVCGLQVSGNVAALWWKQGNGCAAAFFDLSEKKRSPRIAEIAGSPPIWSGLTLVADEKYALIMAWPDRILTVSEAGQQRARDLPEHVSATARTICLTSVANEQCENGAAPRLIVAARTGGMWAYDLIGNRMAYDEQANSVDPSRERCSDSLTVAGQYLIERGGRHVDIYLARTGVRAAAFTVSGNLIETWIHDGLAYALTRERQCCVLSKHALATEKTPSTKPDQPTPAGVKLGDWILPVGEIREAFCIAGKLIVVEDERIRAYTLP